MTDQLDFSKLLLYKVLLSIGNLGNALDANSYAEWNRSYSYTNNVYFDTPTLDSSAAVVLAREKENKQIKQKDTETCTEVMCDKGIKTKHDYKLWARKGGHPDKGGDISTFQKVNACQDAEDFCKEDIELITREKVMKTDPQKGGAPLTSEEIQNNATLIANKRTQLKELNKKLREKIRQGDTTATKAIEQQITELKKSINNLISKQMDPDYQKKRQEASKHHIKVAAEERKKKEAAAVAKPTVEKPTVEKPTTAKAPATAAEKAPATAAEKAPATIAKAPATTTITPKATPETPATTIKATPETPATTAKAPETPETTTSKATEQVQKHVDTAKKHATAIKSKASKHLRRSRRSGHVSGAQFKATENETSNLIYLETVIDDGSNDPSASIQDFNTDLYKQYANKTDYLSSLENTLRFRNNDLVNIVNEFYDAIDPLTLTYLNKLIATAIPFIDRIKLYIFLVSLMPDFSDALAIFIESINESQWLEYRYNKKLDENMRGLFYKYNDVLKEKRAKSIEQTKERKEMLKTAMKNRANQLGNIDIDQIAQTANAANESGVFGAIKKIMPNMGSLGETAGSLGEMAGTLAEGAETLAPLLLLGGTR